MKLTDTELFPKQLYFLLFKVSATCLIPDYFLFFYIYTDVY